MNADSPTGAEGPKTRYRGRCGGVAEEDLTHHVHPAEALKERANYTKNGHTEGRYQILIIGLVFARSRA